MIEAQCHVLICGGQENLTLLRKTSISLSSCTNMPAVGLAKPNQCAFHAPLNYMTISQDHQSSRNAAVMQHWCIGGAFFRPIGIAIYLYNPKGVVTAVRCISSGWTRVWKNEFVISNFDHTFPFVQLDKISSTWGRGCASKTVFVFNIW